MRVRVLVLDGVLDSGLAAVLDALHAAQELGQKVGRSALKIDVERVAVGGQARSALGWAMSMADARHVKTDADVVIVPAMATRTPESVLVALGRDDVREAFDLLNQWSDRANRVATAGSGTFVLAGSGLLDRQQATTSWWLAPLFRERFPQVKLDQTQVVVFSGKTVTARAALAHVDLVLALLRSTSFAVAQVVERYLDDDRGGDSGNEARAELGDGLAGAFERLVRAQLNERFDLEEIAHRLATTPRTLERRVKDAFGVTPVAMVQNLRVERAVDLLQTTSASIDEIATMVGYSEGVTLRALLREKLGRGVRELRSSTMGLLSPGRTGPEG